MARLGRKKSFCSYFAAFWWMILLLLSANPSGAFLVPKSTTAAMFVALTLQETLTGMSGWFEQLVHMGIDALEGLDEVGSLAIVYLLAFGAEETGTLQKEVDLLLLPGPSPAAVSNARDFPIKTTAYSELDFIKRDRFFERSTRNGRDRVHRIRPDDAAHRGGRLRSKTQQMPSSAVGLEVPISPGVLKKGAIPATSAASGRALAHGMVSHVPEEQTVKVTNTTGAFCMSLPTALPGSPSACIRADIVEGHLATASEIEAALLPVVGEVAVSSSNMSNGNDLAHSWIVTFMSTLGDVDRLAVDATRLTNGNVSVQERIKGQANEFRVFPGHNGADPVREGRDAFFTELYKLDRDANPQWESDSGVYTFKPAMYEKQRIRIPHGSAGRFCINFTWRGTVYTTGGGSACPKVDVGSNGLKNILEAFDVLGAVEVSYWHGTEGDDYTYDIGFPDLRGDLPLLQYQPSKIDPLQPGVIDVHELSPGVGEVQKIILFSDRKCVRETQGLTLTTDAGSIPTSGTFNVTLPGADNAVMCAIDATANQVKVSIDSGVPNITVEHVLTGRPSYIGIYQPAGTGKYKASVTQLMPGGLRAQYWDNEFLQGTPTVQRVDPQVSFDWGSGFLTPHSKDRVSVQWRGKLLAPTSETFTILVRADDEMRLYIDHILVIDAWKGLLWSTTERFASVDLVNGTYHDIVLEYWEKKGTANIQLLWSSDSTPAAVVPSSALYYPVHVSGSPFDVSVTPGIETNADAEICGDSHANATANNLTATFTQAKEIYDHKVFTNVTTEGGHPTNNVPPSLSPTTAAGAQMHGGQSRDTACSALETNNGVNLDFLFTRDGIDARRTLPNVEVIAEEDAASQEASPEDDISPYVPFTAAKESSAPHETHGDNQPSGEGLLRRSTPSEDFDLSLIHERVGTDAPEAPTLSAHNAVVDNIFQDDFSRENDATLSVEISGQEKTAAAPELHGSGLFVVGLTRPWSFSAEYSFDNSCGLDGIDALRAPTSSTHNAIADDIVSWKRSWGDAFMMSAGNTEEGSSAAAYESYDDSPSSGGNLTWSSFSSEELVPSLEYGRDSIEAMRAPTSSTHNAIITDDILLWNGSWKDVLMMSAGISGQDESAAAYASYGDSPSPGGNLTRSSTSIDDLVLRLVYGRGGIVGLRNPTSSTQPALIDDIVQKRVSWENGATLPVEISGQEENAATRESYRLSSAEDLTRRSSSTNDFALSLLYHHHDIEAQKAPTSSTRDAVLADTASWTASQVHDAMLPTGSTGQQESASVAGTQNGNVFGEGLDRRSSTAIASGAEKSSVRGLNNMNGGNIGRDTNERYGFVEQTPQLSVLNVLNHAALSAPETAISGKDGFAKEASSPPRVEEWIAGTPAPRAPTWTPQAVVTWAKAKLESMQGIASSTVVESTVGNEFNATDEHLAVEHLPQSGHETRLAADESDGDRPSREDTFQPSSGADTGGLENISPRSSPMKVGEAASPKVDVGHDRVDNAVHSASFNALDQNKPSESSGTTSGAEWSNAEVIFRHDVKQKGASTPTPALEQGVAHQNEPQLADGEHASRTKQAPAVLGKTPASLNGEEPSQVKASGLVRWASWAQCFICLLLVSAFLKSRHPSGLSRTVGAPADQGDVEGPSTESAESGAAGATQAKASKKASRKRKTSKDLAAMPMRCITNTYGGMRCAQRCFLIAATQCLASVPPIRNLLIRYKYDHNGPKRLYDKASDKQHNLLLCLASVFERMVPARGKAARKRGSSAKRNSTQHATALDILDLEVAARAFFTGRGQTVHESMKVRTQEDAAEILAHLLNAMNATFPRSMLGFMDCAVKAIYQCPVGLSTCRPASLPFDTGSVSFTPDSSVGKDLVDREVEWRLKKAYGTWEDGEIKTCKCDAHGQAASKLIVTNAPAILLVEISRTNFDIQGKVDRLVHFPLDDFRLDVSDETNGAQLTTAKYIATAVIKHHGPSFYQGHYTAAVRKTTASNSPWWAYDDNKLSTIDNGRVMKDVSTIIFRRDFSVAS